ncbi:hypothetical protein Tco_0881904 [Tanacetum coccineum]
MKTTCGGAHFLCRLLAILRCFPGGMSGSEPGEMAPESSMVLVFPKFDMHIYTSELTSSKLGKAVEEYGIPLDLHPRLPPPAGADGG